MNARMPTVWLCGPPGVGKSTVGWLLFTRLECEGIPVAYLDIDQLGLRYPTTADDPSNQRVKSRNLNGMLATFARAGAGCVVVSGVVEPDEASAYVKSTTNAEMTWCRLRAEDSQLRERYLGREQSLDLLDEVLSNAHLLDASTFADVVLDTTGVEAAEVVQLLLAGLAGWPRSAPFVLGTGKCATEDTSHDPSPVLWLCGPTPVGKSAVAWRIFEDVRRDGFTAGYIDLEQVGFLRPAPADDPANHRVKARNVEALRATYRTAGADCLVVSGSVESTEAVALYRAALPGARLSLCRLRAGKEELAERVMLRSGDGGPHLAGDRIRGLEEDDLGHVVEQALRQQSVLDQAGIGDVVLDTDGLSVGEVADRLRERAGGWPGQPGGRL